MKHEIRKFHIAVVRQWQRNVHKSLIASHYIHTETTSQAQPYLFFSYVMIIFYVVKKSCLISEIVLPMPVLYSLINLYILKVVLFISLIGFLGLPWAPLIHLFFFFLILFTYYY